MTTAAIPTEEARQDTPLARDLAARFAVEFDGSGEHMLGDDAHRYRRIAFALFFVYMAVAVGIYLWRGVWFTPDRWAVFLLVGALVLGRLGSFLRDWIPFVLLIFGYEYLRGIAGEIVAGGQRVWELPREAMPAVRLEGLIRFDEVLFFGHSPILLLQQLIYQPGTPRWWDFLALVMYSMHFVLPCVFAFILWLTSKRQFWTFTLAFCLMTYAAFAFFLLVPAAPPWLAQAWGVIGGINFPQNHVLDVIQPQGFETLDTYAIWGNASPHPVAAMPSLHAGFSWLVLLFAVRYYGWRGSWFLVYNIALWYAVVYTANHWFVDVLAGIAWATIAFFTVIGALAVSEQRFGPRSWPRQVPGGKRRAVAAGTPRG